MSVRIITGDCRDILPTLSGNSFDCCVTSPPYYGLRDYQVDGQIGLEPTLALYLKTMVDVFREVRRVLKPSGTFWLNIGDSYNGGGIGGGSGANTTLAGSTNRERQGNGRRPTKVSSLKAKDLMMVPNRLALLLQEDGWYIRSEIIWFKQNPMPESVTDRPTCAHEKVWLLTKGERYFYDAGAIAEPMVKGGAGSSFTEGKTGVHQLGRASTKPRRDKQQDIADNANASTARRAGGFNERWNASEANGLIAETRNARNVWAISAEPYRGAHYAVMPSTLAERCIKAGSPPGGSVLDPFGGAGTTGLVADRLGRDATLIELNPRNREMAADRVSGDFPLFAEVSA